jgi:transposase
MQFRVSKSTVQRWVTRSQGTRLDRVNFGNKKSGVQKQKNKTPNKIEKVVLRIRKQLKEKSILGLYGANAIRDEMIRLGNKTVPSARTINNILKRHGKIDYKKRGRHKAPPAGWYLLDLADRRAELDRFDIVEGLYLRGGQEVQ